MVDEARALRLAGSFDEAEAKLNELKIDADSTDLANWAYQLERLHLDISRQIDAATAVSVEPVGCVATCGRSLVSAQPRPGAEQAELAALKVFIATRLDAAAFAAQPVADDVARAISGKEHWSKVLAKPEQARLETIQKAFAERIVAAVSRCHRPGKKDWSRSGRASRRLSC